MRSDFTFGFPLSLRMVEEILAARGISVTHENLRQWGKKFGRAFAEQICRRAPAQGDRWHLDEVVVSIASEKHWLWRAVDQNGFVLDVLGQRRRDTRAARRFMKRVQIGQTGAAVSVDSRSSCEPFPPPISPNGHRSILPLFARASLCGLARDLHHSAAA